MLVRAHDEQRCGGVLVWDFVGVDQEKLNNWEKSSDGSRVLGLKTFSARENSLVRFCFHFAESSVVCLTVLHRAWDIRQNAGQTVDNRAWGVHLRLRV
jgi:hypothetical protein